MLEENKPQQTHQTSLPGADITASIGTKEKIITYVYIF